MVTKVWCPDDETEADVRPWRYFRDEPEEAADRFVSDGWDADSRLGVTRVNVREYGGELHEFDVEARAEVAFYVRARTEEAEK